MGLAKSKLRMRKEISNEKDYQIGSFPEEGKRTGTTIPLVIPV